MKTTLRLLTLAFTLATALPAATGLAQLAPSPPFVPVPTDLLPPPTAALFSDISGDGVINYPDTGVMVSDLRMTRFTSAMPPPGPGETQMQDFGATVNLRISMGAGSPTLRITAPAQVTISTVLVGIDFRPQNGHQILKFDVSGGGLPAGVMMRESPTLASTGGSTLRNVIGTNTWEISSFFDIFTEISVDGGANWTASDRALHGVWKAPANERPFTTGFLPVPADFDGDGSVAFGQGVVFRNLKLRDPSESFAPPLPGASQTHTIMAIYDGDVAFDGKTFSQFSAPAIVTQKVTNYLTDGNTQFFDTEMLQLDVGGGSLPQGVMLRESPTQPSTGRVHIRAVPEGGLEDFRIGSFFDVFFEVSVDGGMNWLPTRDGPCVFAVRDTVPTALVSVGDAVPEGAGIPPGAVFTSVGVPAIKEPPPHPIPIEVDSISANSPFAFLGKWRVPGSRNPDGVGVFVAQRRQYQPILIRKIAMVGDKVGVSPLGGGREIKSIKEGLVIDDAGNVLFTTATIGVDSGESASAILIGLLPPPPSTVQLAVVVATGTAVADVPGALLKSFTSVASLGGGRVLFVGKLAGSGIGGKNDRVVCATDLAGVPHVLIQEGVTPMSVTVGGTTGTFTTKNFQVLQIVPGSFNNVELVSRVTFLEDRKGPGPVIVHTFLP